MNQRPPITLDRRQVVAAILKQRRQSLLVTGLGTTSWDAAAAGDHDHNFYLWGAMGGAALTGLGLALAQPQRRVLVITGDGEQLMGLGGLATIALQQPENLSVVVIDNESYGETGMQPTHTRYATDLAAVAAASGFARSMTVYTEQELDTAIPELYDRAGPVMTVVKVTTDPQSSVLPPRDGTLLKHRFRRAILGTDVP